MTVAARAFVVAASCALAASCARQPEWPPPAAFRAVARAVAADEAGARIAVQGAVARSSAELPWGVRQALTTAGFDVVPAAAPPAEGGVSLRFREIGRSEPGDWLITTEVLSPGSAEARVERWTVPCDADACTIAARLHEAGPPARSPP